MEFLKKNIRPYRIEYYKKQRKKEFKAALREATELNLVVGSSGVYQVGWIPSEWHFLNLLVEEDWHKYFKENSIRAILAEHVWEHLTQEQGKKAASICYKFLKKPGTLRIAVPDGYHSSREYIEFVKVGGSGRGAHDHKILFNYKSLGNLLSASGFSIDTLEYFDENGNFHSKEWSDSKGLVHRSKKAGYVDVDGISNYTSLIIDAKKI